MDLCDLEVSLIYIESSRITQRDLVSKRKEKERSERKDLVRWHLPTIPALESQARPMCIESYCLQNREERAF